MSYIHFMPPVPGTCPVCGAKHKKGEAHDEKSAYYQMRRRRNRKWGNGGLDPKRGA